MTPSPTATIGTIGIGVIGVFVVGSVLTVGAQPDVAPPGTEAATSTTVAAAGAPDFVLPADYVMLVDATERITIAVPASMNSDTAPEDDEGAVIPRISAGVNLDDPSASRVAPGVLYVAIPYNADTYAVFLERSGLRPGCSALEVLPYDDGAFVGRWWKQTGCGGLGDGEFHVIVASPASQVATVVVTVQLGDTDETPLLDAALASFNFTPTATWPVPSVGPPTSEESTSTVPTSSGAPSTTVPTSAPPSVESSPLPVAAPVGVATIRLVNNSGLLAMDVPSGWSEVQLTGGINNDGSYRPAIVAAPNLEQFRGAGFGAPGAFAFALPPGIDLDTALANARHPTDCAATEPTPFESADFSGLLQTWSNCAGGTMDVTILAAGSADGSFTVHARIQEQAGGDLATTMLDSLAIDGATTYPTSTSLPAPETTVGAAPSSLWQSPPEVATDFVVDGTRNLTVDVPASWSDLSLHPGFNDDVSPRPRIVASVDLEAMGRLRVVPGMYYIELPYVDAATFMANTKGATLGCEDGGLQSFDNGAYRGLMRTLVNCDGIGARIVSVVASPPDNSATLFVEVQLPSEDDTVLRVILASFSQI